LLPCKQVTYTPCLLHMKCHFVCVHNDYSTQRCIVSRTNSTTVGYSWKQLFDFLQLYISFTTVNTKQC
jgi:hypothetical protein